MSRSSLLATTPLSLERLYHPSDKLSQSNRSQNSRLDLDDYLPLSQPKTKSGSYGLAGSAEFTRPPTLPHSITPTAQRWLGKTLEEKKDDSMLENVVEMKGCVVESKKVMEEIQREVKEEMRRLRDDMKQEMAEMKQILMRSIEATARVEQQEAQTKDLEFCNEWDEWEDDDDEREGQMFGIAATEDNQSRQSGETCPFLKSPQSKRCKRAEAELNLFQKTPAQSLNFGSEYEQPRCSQTASRWPPASLVY